MQLLLEEICQNLRNWFCRYEDGDVISGTFNIAEGVIIPIGKTKLPEIEDGTYFRIVGSFKNNGVYIKGTDIPVDESFNGQIWLLHFPAAFLALVSEIAEWQEKNGAIDSTNMSPFTSESFGGYSYSKGSGTGSGGGAAVSWQNQFASRLNAWRKI